MFWIRNFLFTEKQTFEFFTFLLINKIHWSTPAAAAAAATFFVEIHIDYWLGLCFEYFMWIFWKECVLSNTRWKLKTEVDSLYRKKGEEKARLHTLHILICYEKHFYANSSVKQIACRTIFFINKIDLFFNKKNKSKT